MDRRAEPSFIYRIIISSSGLSHKHFIVAFPSWCSSSSLLRSGLQVPWQIYGRAPWGGDNVMYNLHADMPPSAVWFFFLGRVRLTVFNKNKQNTISRFLVSKRICKVLLAHDIQGPLCIAVTQKTSYGGFSLSINCMKYYSGIRPIESTLNSIAITPNRLWIFDLTGVPL